MFGSVFPPEVLDFVPSNALANAQAGMTSDRVSIVDTDVVMVRVSFEAGLADNAACSGHFDHFEAMRQTAVALERSSPLLISGN